MTTYPKIEQIARKIDLSSCLDVCPVALELYGVHVPELNRSKARTALSRAYYNNRDKYLPSDDEMTAGLGVMEARFHAYLEANR